MSNGQAQSTPVEAMDYRERVQSNKDFVNHLKSNGLQRSIKRHTTQARLTHGITVILIFSLIITGLFVFVPPLVSLVGDEVVMTIRRHHRIFGVAFVIVPLVSALLAPKGFVEMMQGYVDNWDSDDKKWMMLFMPYLFAAKRIELPEQSKVKSGQRISDGILLISGFMMAVSGVILLINVSFYELPGSVHRVALFIHDLFFLLLIIFILMHVFLGGGIFQPYRGMHNVMWGDGNISEEDALYHWAHWARDEIDKGNVMYHERNESENEALGDK